MSQTTRPRSRYAGPRKKRLSAAGQCAWLLLATVLLLSACSRQPARLTADRPADWDLRQKALTALDTWDLNGRIAVTLEKNGGSASLVWQQRADTYSIQLFGPFGKGAVKLQGGPEGVSMEDDEGRTTRAADPETLLLQHLGWQVPVSGLKHWIKGSPAPDIALDNLLLDEQGRIGELAQGGWRISYSHYREIDAFALPTRLRLINRELKVKLLIKHWELYP